MPQNSLYPLIYKSGIKRDGTPFQADYCTDSQWIRFQRGNIRKMGGMKGINDPTLNARTTVSNITVLPETGNNANMRIYVANNENGIHTYLINQNFTDAGPTNTTQVYNQNHPNTIWKSETVIQGNNKRIVFLGSSNLSNINSGSAAVLIGGNINNNLGPLPNPPANMVLNGLLYTSNFLFLYGSNGLVQWSKLSDPFDFSNSNSRSINVSTDAVIDAKAIRGGTNSPTILFWTLSSVIRCINTPDTAGNLQFQIDTLSKTSSILSTRCVIEYDGLFFWPGTNRFFQYNGIVQELSNTMNLNYFYDNIDMDHRQKVVGVKNTKYGEIWWFYPEKKNAPNRDPAIPEGVNSRAIIYNIRENAWYDTAISRMAAVYSEDFGFMATYGQAVSIPYNTNSNSLYRHEYENLTPNRSLITEFIPTGGSNFQVNPIPSYFTTPYFSWAAFNPMKQLIGNDRWISLITIEPDFILMPDNPDLQIVINVKQYAQSFPLSSSPFPVPPVGTALDSPLIGKMDTAFQGRHMNLTITSQLSNFEVGHIMLSLGIGDGK